jgi:2-oxo-4-hydroxy-4-carboxy-5-ureidoimidazoline decarboxylase
MEPWRRLDEADAEEARLLLARCCGARAWVEGMMARRPFGDRATLLAAAREVWLALAPGDWREGFAHHPKIGDREALRQRFAATGHLSEREQAGVDSATDGVISALAGANRAYQERFGYIFIVCATGKSAGEMLAMLEERMRNDPGTEIRVAADEQARITEIRLLELH